VLFFYIRYLLKVKKKSGISAVRHGTLALGTIRRGYHISTSLRILFFSTLHLVSSGGYFFWGLIYGGFTMSYENSSALQQFSMLRFGLSSFRMHITFSSSREMRIIRAITGTDIWDLGSWNPSFPLLSCVLCRFQPFDSICSYKQALNPFLHK